MTEMRAKQTRLESILERCVDMVTGVLLAYFAWLWIVPLIWPQYNPPAGESMGLTLFFTAISFFRGFFWRRFFENGVHKLIHKMVRKARGPEET